MARLIGPDEASREVKTIVGRTFRSKAGRPAQLWADEAATVPADVLNLDGSAIPNSTVTIDANSMLPLMQFPEGVDTIYVQVDGGPVWPVYARTDDRLDALDDRLDALDANPFAGRKWTALGTSITSMGLYTAPLAAALGLELTNLGVSGGTLSKGITNDVNFFGNGAIFDRLYQVPADAELVTLEVGVNDFRSSVRLGSFGDTDESTFYGALWAALDHLRTYRPNALVVCLTPYGFTEDTFAGTWSTPNGWGRYLREYQRAIHEVAAVFSVPVIPVGEESGIGVRTAAAWMSDGLHLNAAGGQVYADFVASRLKRVFTAWPPLANTPEMPAAPTWSSSNLVANGDFESNVAGWSFRNGASFVQSGAGEPFVTGTRSARFTTAEATSLPPMAYTWAITTGIAVGGTYRARVFCRMPTESMPSSGPPAVTCRLNFMDDANATTLAVDTVRRLLENEWVEFQMVGTAPEGTTQANIQVRYPTVTPAGFFFYVDGVSLVARMN